MTYGIDIISCYILVGFQKGIIGVKMFFSTRSFSQLRPVPSTCSRSSEALKHTIFDEIG